MTVTAKLPREAAQIETIAATGVQNNVVSLRASHLADARQQWRSHAPIMQAAASRDSRQCIARKFRSTLLRL
jgi:hypothetical protein